MKLSVAIPESALSDDSLKIDKTRKISVLARACSIFRVDTIYVYQDGDNKQDGSLLVMILKYLEGNWYEKMKFDEFVKRENKS